MAVQDNLDSVFNEPAIGSEFDRVEARIVKFVSNVEDAAKKVGAIQIKLGGDLSLGELKSIQKEAEDLTNQQIKSMKAIADEKLKEAKAEEVLSRTRLNSAKLQSASAKKAAKEETDLLKKQAQEATHTDNVRKKIFADKAKRDKQELQQQKEIAQAAKVEHDMMNRLEADMNKRLASLAKENNAYEIAKKTHTDLSNEAKRLYFALGAESEQFKKVSAEAFKMHQQLLKAESSVGQMQRQVGNYNMVGAQFNQLLREAPNFAISMRTGIMALTNNVTYFGESIKAARKEGQSYMTILKSMGNSMFGLVGILNLAVLAITYFSLKASSAETATSKAEEATKRYKDALNEAGKSANRSAMEEQTRLNILNKVATDVTKSTKARNEAVKEMQKLYPGYLANYTEEAIKAGKAAGAIDLITTAIIKRAAASAAEKRVIASGEKILDLEMARAKAVAEQAKSYNQLSDAQNSASQSTVQTSTAPQSGNALLAVYEMRAAMAEKNLKEINKAIADEKEMQKQFANLAVAAVGESLETQKDKPEDDKGGSSKAKEAIQKRLKDISKLQFEAQKEQIEAEMKAQKDIATNEELSYQERTDAIERFYYLKKQLIEEAGEYEKMTGAKTAIEAAAIEEKTQSEIIELSRETLAMETDAANDKIEQDKAANKLKIANLKSLFDYFKAGADAQTKYEKEQSKKRIEFIGQVVNAAQQAAAIYSKLADERTKRELEGLDREQQEVQNTEERERARAERTITDKAKLEEAISNIEGKADAERMRIEDRRREADKKQAQRAKELAILNVVANMVIGISKEIASKGVAGLATSAAIGVYIAGLTGIIAALAVPAYAEGTGNHPGGLARVGDGGEHELVSLPGGKSFISPNTDTLMNLPAGTEVIPMPDLKPGLISPEAMNMVMLQGGGDSAKTEKLLEQLIKEVRNGNNGKPLPESWERDGMSHYSMQKGNNRFDYLRKGWYE